ncbi:MAG: hypothetical protein ACOYI8_07100 [Christensenellales bacterium]|jgi:hypothetical protein
MYILLKAKDGKGREIMAPAETEEEALLPMYCDIEPKPYCMHSRPKGEYAPPTARDFSIRRAFFVIKTARKRFGQRFDLH